MFNLGEVYKDAVKKDPALRQGLVKCRHCAKELKVDSALCLKEGWPKCCGSTMMLESYKGDKNGET